MEDKKTSLFYKFLYFLVWLFSPRIRFEGQENLPQEPCIIVGNHSQMYGPVAAELDMPGYNYIWCAGQMMTRKECADYMFTDFWSYKPKWIQPYFRLVSHLVVPISMVVFNGAHCIPVWHDNRLLSTFRESIQRLKQGWNLVIFPEKFALHNNILYQFQDKFIDVARFYYKQTGKALSFVPLYIAPKLKKAFYLKPITFDPTAKIDTERERICRAIMDSITEFAVSLPEHTVVPYRNIRKRDYPKNTPLKVYDE